MDGAAFVERVRDEHETELHRLGSDKYLIAATGADLTESAVLRSVARTAASGRERFDAWAAAETGPADERFAAAADTERDHYERVTGRLDGTDDIDPADDPLHAALGDVATTPARAGAMVGRALVTDRTRLQAVNFFVNEGDTAGADLLRDLREDAGDQRDAAADLLGAVCADDEHWSRAGDGADRVVAAAYGAYADALEDLGVDPKPVC